MTGLSCPTDLTQAPSNFVVGWGTSPAGWYWTAREGWSERSWWYQRPILLSARTVTGPLFPRSSAFPYRLSSFLDDGEVCWTPLPDHCRSLLLHDGFPVVGTPPGVICCSRMYVVPIRVGVDPGSASWAWLIDWGHVWRRTQYRNNWRLSRCGVFIGSQTDHYQ